MRRLSVVLVSAALIVSCLFLIAMQSASPLLYSPRIDAIADDHVNAGALTRVTGDRAERVLPLVSDLLNSPGSLILTIKANDYENVARELEEYRQLSRNLDSLVINLDMTESEIAEFRKANTENLHILTELSNGTERWEELKTLEIRYREGGDSQMLTSITYEGESLQRKIQDLYRDYLDQEDVMVKTGEKFNLDTSSYIESEREFREIVHQVETGQEERVSTGAGGASTGDDQYQLTIDLLDREVSYAERMQVDGLIRIPGGGKPEDVDIFIDSQKAASVPTGVNGSFSFAQVVEHERAGTHTVFAVYSGSVFSEIMTFVVETEDALLILEPPGVTESHVVFSGALRTDTAAVGNAPVEILSDGKRASTVTTDSGGNFRVSEKIPPGDHTVKALFQADSYPLSPSESAEYKITVPEPAPSIERESGFFANPLHIGVLIASICVSCIAAFFYLRRRRPGSIPVSPIFHLPGNGLPEEREKRERMPISPLPREQDEIPGILDVQAGLEPGMDPGYLFSTLRKAVSRHLSFLHPGSLTPRELCSLCKNLPFSTAVCRFARDYEQNVYGGQEISGDNRETILAAYSSAMESLEGIDH